MISVLCAILRSIYIISKYFFSADTARKVKCKGSELFSPLDSQHKLGVLFLIISFVKEGDLVLI